MWKNEERWVMGKGTYRRFFELMHIGRRIQYPFQRINQFWNNHISLFSCELHKWNTCDKSADREKGCHRWWKIFLEFTLCLGLYPSGTSLGSIIGTGLPDMVSGASDSALVTFLLTEVQRYINSLEQGILRTWKTIKKVDEAITRIHAIYHSRNS